MTTQRKTTIGRINDQALCDRCDTLMKKIVNFRQRGWTQKAHQTSEQLLLACRELGRRIEREKEQVQS